MAKKLQAFSHIIQTLEALVIVATVATGAVAIVWATLIDWGPLIFPILLVMVASGISIFNWVRDYKARRGVPSKDLVPTITQWLIKAGYHVGELRSQDYNFALTITAPDGKHLVVEQPTNSPDIIMIGAGLRLSVEHTAAYSRLTEDKQGRLAEILILAVSQTGLQWGGFGPPFDKMQYFLSVVYNNTFNRYLLLNAIFKVRTVSTSIIQVINLALNMQADGGTKPLVTDESDVRIPGAKPKPAS